MVSATRLCARRLADGVAGPGQVHRAVFEITPKGGQNPQPHASLPDLTSGGRGVLVFRHLPQDSWAQCSAASGHARK